MGFDRVLKFLTLSSVFTQIEVSASRLHPSLGIILKWALIGVSRGGGAGGPDPPFPGPPFSSVTAIPPNPISQTNVM